MYIHIFRLTSSVFIASALFLASAGEVHAYQTPGEAFGLPSQSGTTSGQSQQSSSSSSQQGGSASSQQNAPAADIIIPSLGVINPNQPVHGVDPGGDHGILRPPVRTSVRTVGVGRSISPAAIVGAQSSSRSTLPPSSQPAPPPAPARPARRSPAVQAPVPQQILPGSGSATHGAILLSVLLSTSILLSRRYGRFLLPAGL